MEFAIDIHSDVIMVPPGYRRTGTTPDGKEGLKWKAKYASVGVQRCGTTGPIRRVNEKGLAAGTFYCSHLRWIYASYTAADAGKTIRAVGSGIVDPGETSPASRR